MWQVAELGAGTRATILELVRESLAGSRPYLQTLSRAFIDGMPPAEWPGGFPAVKVMLDLLMDEQKELRGGDADEVVRARVMTLVSMAVGWILLEDALLEIVGLAEEDRDLARGVLLRTVDDLLRPGWEPDAPRP
jgi:hypothetical protein